MSDKKIIIGYSIKCDDELNPPEAVARNEFRARLTVHYAELPDEIVLTIENDNDIRSDGGAT